MVLRALLAAAAVAAAAVAAPSCVTPSGNPNGTWTLVFVDDFDTLNTTTWAVLNGSTHCCPEEPQLYLARNVVASGGVLTITTKGASACSQCGDDVSPL
jgi:hypothetical protein